MPSKPSKATTKQLEEKFARTAFRLSQERSDFLLPQILDFVKKEKWLNLRPEYQRRLVWDVGKRSRFIESLLLNIPIPSIFLYESDLSRYEVMDGQQRLHAVVEFYENGYALSGLEKWPELHGFRFKDLPETLRRGLDRRRLSATVLLLDAGVVAQEERGDVRRLVFERLNTGGQQLNAQELRNCLYSGPFNELLIELSRAPVFTKVWNIPEYEEHSDSQGDVDQTLAENRLYKRMIDCELVLRFFAFRAPSRIKGAVRRILDTFMRDNESPPQEELEAMRQDFKNHLELAEEIFGDRTFRHADENGTWNLSVPLYDAVMIALDRLWEERLQLSARRKAISKAIAALYDDEKNYDVMVGGPNTAKAIINRLELATETIRSAARL
jgi:hypothetical protein